LKNINVFLFNVYKRFFYFCHVYYVFNVFYFFSWYVFLNVFLHL